MFDKLLLCFAFVQLVVRCCVFALFFVFWGFSEVVRVGEVSILTSLYTIPLSGGKFASSCMPMA